MWHSMQNTTYSITRLFLCSLLTFAQSMHFSSRTCSSHACGSYRPSTTSYSLDMAAPTANMTTKLVRNRKILFKYYYSQNQNFWFSFGASPCCRTARGDTGQIERYGHVQLPTEGMAHQKLAVSQQPCLLGLGSLSRASRPDTRFRKWLVHDTTRQSRFRRDRTGLPRGSHGFPPHLSVTLKYFTTFVLTTSF